MVLFHRPIRKPPTTCVMNASPYTRSISLVTNIHEFLSSPSHSLFVAVSVALWVSLDSSLLLYRAVPALHCLALPYTAIQHTLLVSQKQRQAESRHITDRHWQLIYSRISNRSDHIIFLRHTDYLRQIWIDHSNAADWLIYKNRLCIHINLVITLNCGILCEKNVSSSV